MRIASDFPLGGGLAQQRRFHVPRVAIRLKKIPRLRSITTGGVSRQKTIPFHLERLALLPLPLDRLELARFQGQAVAAIHQKVLY